VCVTWTQRAGALVGRTLLHLARGERDYGDLCASRQYLVAGQLVQSAVGCLVMLENVQIEWPPTRGEQERLARLASYICRRAGLRGVAEDVRALVMGASCVCPR